MTEVAHTYRVGWRLHNREQMETATVKLFDFGKLLKMLREKHGASTKTCAELVIHEILPDGTVAVRLEHEDGQPIRVRGKELTTTIQSVTDDAENCDTDSCKPRINWGGWGKWGYDDTEEVLADIGTALGAFTPTVPIRLPKKNRKLLVKEK